MVDQNRNILIDISGDTANMATEYGTSGVSLGDAHVPLSKVCWGDENNTYRTTLSQGLPVTLAGQTGAIEIRGRISGETGESVNMVNFINTDSGGVVGYGSRSTGHHTQFVAVAGNTSGETHFYNASNTATRFYTNSAERLVIASDGTVIAGAASVSGGNRSQYSILAAVSNNTSATGHGVFTIQAGANSSSGNEVAQLCFSDPQGDYAWIQAFADAATGSTDKPGRLVFSTSADGAAIPTERLRITSAGKVGIGTNAPDGTLEVWGSIFVTSQGSGQSSGIWWSDPDNKSDYFQWYMTTDNDLRLKTAGGAWKDTIHIHNEGRIGIGTDAPATRDVNGSVDIVQNHNNTGPHFRVLNKHATMGGGVQVKNNNARGGVEFLNTSGSNSGALYHTTGGWTWDQTLNLPSSSTYLRIGTNTGNHMLVVDSSSSTDGHIIATFNGAESSNHAGLNIAHYLCGSDDNRTGLYWEHQNVANVRMWMGDDRRLYLKNSDPTESTAQGRYLMTIERGSADFPDGSSYDNAAKSALEIKKHYPNSQTGNYWIYDYNGVPRQIHCEMEIDGGGWMMWHDHNVSNTSMNEALGGTASSPHSGLGRGNYGNYAYYQVLIRASKVGNASREALHTIVQLDHNGNLFRKYNLVSSN